MNLQSERDRGVEGSATGGGDRSAPPFLVFPVSSFGAQVCRLPAFLPLLLTGGTPASGVPQGRGFWRVAADL